MLDIIFVADVDSLVSVVFREALSHPYISFFHLLVNGFSVTCFRTFFADPFLILIGGRGGIKMASASTLSLNEPARASLSTQKS